MTFVVIAVLDTSGQVIYVIKKNFNFDFNENFKQLTEQKFHLIYIFYLEYEYQTKSIKLPLLSAFYTVL